MHILNVITAAQRRGAELYALELGARLGPRHVTTTVALAPGTTTPSLEVPVLGARPLSPSTIRVLRRAMAEADLTIAHGSRALPACALAGGPFVYRSIGDPSYWAQSRARRLRVAWALRRAQRVVALWPEAASWIATTYGIDPRRMAVIPNGADATRFRPATTDERRDARRELGLDDDRPVAALIGSLTDEKDPLTAVAAAATSDVGLIVAGAGPLQVPVEQRCRSLGVDLHLVGVVPRPERVYAAADAVLLSSLTEGMPGVAIEAGLSGLPVAGTSVGGVPVVVEQGRTGYLTEPASAPGLGAALGQALVEGAELGVRARERCVRLFDLDVTARQWAALIERMEHEPHG